MLIVIDSRMSTLFGRPRATSIQEYVSVTELLALS